MTAEGTIVVAGEALYDLVLSEGDTLAGHPGGGPYNTARTLARLGRPVAFLGRISTDRLGARLRRELENDGVLTSAVVATDEPTTLAVAEMDRGGVATYNFYTAGTAASGLRAAEAVAALPAHLAALHLGTLGLVLEPTATALEAVLETVDERAVVMLDPNVRPQLITDPEGYRRRLTRVLRRVDVVKVSDKDLEWLSPGLELVEAARRLVQAGPQVALLTHGASGATVVTAGGSTFVPAVAVEVVDTIGAGDAFGGGFLAWWHESGLGRAELGDGEATLAGTRFACEVAALTCARVGALPPLRSELSQ
jgi:fructokinase